ncbi:hypothetical protein [Paenibacillus sp. V4I3]|uniref:hypothetical protein n=1 Tax=Paenibacillus sp. V4I3 TaxID=3042305 RepID=UPI0027D7E5B2|nr:hypothetical protein [Paenibacillus sp. V4I3]
MKLNSEDKFNSAVSLYIVTNIIEDEKLTQEQANKVIEALVRFYGATSEEQILSCGDEELILIYNDFKEKILERVC